MTFSLGIWTVRQDAEALAVHLASHLGGEVFLALPSNKAAFARQFRLHRRWIFIGTAGIAVRYLDGLTRDKHSDPALVVLDEAARCAIALLGGHEMGANELAYQVANLTGAAPVISTATEALKPLALGIGCRKNVSFQQIASAVESALQLVSRQIADVREVATIDLKQGETALLEWCKVNRILLRVIAREQVAARPWVTQPSAWVRENLGVDGVCEPCALIASPRGKLLLPKTLLDGVAVAIVEDVPFSFSCHPERSAQRAVEGPLILKQQTEITSPSASLRSAHDDGFKK